MRTEKLPFSVQGFNSGKYRVVTRTGKKVTIHNLRETVENYPILAEIDETDKSEGRNLQVFTIDGKYRCDGRFAENDLFLVRDVYEWGDIVTLSFGKEEMQKRIAILNEEIGEQEKVKVLAMVHVKSPLNTPGGLDEDMYVSFDVCRLATEEEQARLFAKLKANKKRYNHITKEIIDEIPVAKIVEYEPIGKVYESGVVINTKLTRAQKLEVIKALAESLK